MATKAIQFKNVHYTVGNTPILKGINGAIQEGKITTLIGPSGAGKTTLLKLCNGLISPTSGEIFIQRKPISTFEPIALRKKVGIALQNAPMVQGSVYDNLNIPMQLKDDKLSIQDGIHFLDIVGLEKKFIDYHVNDLSGGQRQRVSIARTLINESAILLLDEITSALDKAAATEIEKLIVKINEQYGVTMIWITHNIEQAKTVADNMWVMIAGELVETGNVDQIEATKNQFVKQFLSGGIV